MSSDNEGRLVDYCYLPPSRDILDKLGTTVDALEAKHLADQGLVKVGPGTAIQVDRGRER